MRSPPMSEKRAWRRETTSSGTRMSAPGARPTMMGPMTLTLRPRSALGPLSTVNVHTRAALLPCPFTRPMPVRITAKRKR